jgi:hypothetical protein
MVLLVREHETLLIKNINFDLVEVTNSQINILL